MAFAICRCTYSFSCRRIMRSNSRARTSPLCVSLCTAQHE